MFTSITRRSSAVAIIAALAIAVAGSVSAMSSGQANKSVTAVVAQTHV